MGKRLNKKVLAARAKRVPPFVFISHNHADMVMAKELGHLLTAISGGTLKFFISSDLIGKNGIPYGSEWYATVHQKLSSATDVVCLLTEDSINKPWILYEAGYAKRNLADTHVHGMAIGLGLEKLGATPFAQLQICADNDESFTGLMLQLMSRVPNAEPDNTVVMENVLKFRGKIEKILKSKSEPVKVYA